MKKIVLICSILFLIFIFVSCSGNTELDESQLVSDIGLSSSDISSSESDIDASSSSAVSSEDSSEEPPQIYYEDPYLFPEGSFITTSDISIDTGTVVYDIAANIFVPAHLQDITEPITETIEKVSGLDFDGNGYCMLLHQDGKVHVNVTKENLYANFKWYQGLKTNEFGSAYADTFGHATVTPGDLFLGGAATIIHELSHVLMFRQTEWAHSQFLDEGIAEYTTYLTLRDLEQNFPGLIPYLNRSTYSFSNMQILNYSELYKHPIAHWFENTFEFAPNANYAIGFRFMWYLDEVYGNYTEWITKFEQEYPFKDAVVNINSTEVDQQIEILKMTYGEDVLANFYPWLQQNQDKFETAKYSWKVDLSSIDDITLYPVFNAIASEAKLIQFQYNDLYIDLEMLRKYLTEYKSIDASNLTLKLSRPATVNLYQADGSYITCKKNLISLDGVSYIKLVGSGALTQLEVVGFAD